MLSMVRRYLEYEMPREYAHIITGTYGTKLIMNENNQYPGTPLAIVL